MKNYQQSVAKALLDIQAVRFTPQEPVRFKSGLLSPIYLDNRIFPFYPVAWRRVLAGFKQMIESEKIQFDLIAGVESAGIPHSAALGFSLKKPSVFVRKALKEHGTKKRVEGGNVKGKQVVLIEDHITTGSSSLAGVDALRTEGAKVKHCLAITSYEFEVADTLFSKSKVKLHTLTNFSIILNEALKRKLFSLEEKRMIEDWFKDSNKWEKKYFG